MTSLVSFRLCPFTTRSKEGATVSATLLSLCVIEITEDSQGQSSLYSPFLWWIRVSSGTIWLLCGADVIHLDILDRVYSVCMNIYIKCCREESFIVCLCVLFYPWHLLFALAAISPDVLQTRNMFLYIYILLCSINVEYWSVSS